MKCFKWLSTLGVLLLSYGISQATCLSPLSNATVEGPAYQVLYATGPNNACIDYYLDTSGNQGNWGNNLTQGKQTINGPTIFAPQIITGISTTTTITPTSTFVQLVSTGGLVTVGLVTNNAGQTYYPGISTATAVAGQYVIFYSTSSNAVQISTGSGLSSNNGVVGSAYELSSANPKVLQFIYDATQSVWRELHD